MVKRRLVSLCSRVKSPCFGMSLFLFSVNSKTSLFYCHGMFVTLRSYASHTFSDHNCHDLKVLFFNFPRPRVNNMHTARNARFVFLPRGCMSSLSGLRFVLLIVDVWPVPPSSSLLCLLLCVFVPMESIDFALQDIRERCVPSADSFVPSVSAKPQAPSHGRYKSKK